MKNIMMKNVQIYFQKLLKNKKKNIRKLNFSKLGTLSFPLEARKFGAIKFHFSKDEDKKLFQNVFFLTF